MSATASIRIKSETRDLLSQVAAEHGFTSVDSTIAYLLNEQWKADCIDEADRFRAQDSQGWRDEQADLARWDLDVQP